MLLFIKEAELKRMGVGYILQIEFEQSIYGLRSPLRQPYKDQHPKTYAYIIKRQRLTTLFGIYPGHIKILITFEPDDEDAEKENR